MNEIRGMIEIRLNQVVWNIREKESTRPALLYDYIHASQTVLNFILMMLTTVLLTDLNLDFALNNMLIFFMNLEILRLKKFFF